MPEIPELPETLSGGHLSGQLEVVELSKLPEIVELSKLPEIPELPKLPDQPGLTRIYREDLQTISKPQNLHVKHNLAQIENKP